MPYHYLEDVATADIAFIAEGRDLSETFIAAATATMEVMVENLDAIRPRERRLLSLHDNHLDLLLFNLLQEVIFYKDAEQLLLLLQKVSIEEKEDGYELRAEGAGEILDPARHIQRADVKAVTLHQFQLARTDQGWKAMVILDI